MNYAESTPKVFSLQICLMNYDDHDGSNIFIKFIAIDCFADNARDWTAQCIPAACMAVVVQHVTAVTAEWLPL